MTFPYEEGSLNSGTKLRLFSFSRKVMKSLGFLQRLDLVLRFTDFLLLLVKVKLSWNSS